MKKIDCSFSENDLKRIYCRHLDTTERKNVRQFFKNGADCTQFEAVFDSSEEACELIRELIGSWLNIFNEIEDLLKKIRKTLIDLKKVVESTLPAIVSNFFSEKIDDILEILLDPAIEGLNNFNKLIIQVVDLLEDLIC